MNMNLKSIAVIIAVAFSVWSSSCSATRVSHWRKLKATSATFNVLDYGAKGDGHADDTKVIFFTSILCFSKWVQLHFCFLQTLSHSSKIISDEIINDRYMYTL